MKEILKNTFGYSSFKPFQEQIIQSILNKHDTLAILPTGGGKSLCYQLPILLQEGICVVISPLIALMYDQVRALNELNLNAYMLSSNQTQSENNQSINELKKGNVKFLYLSPERLFLGDFVEFLKSLHVKYFVIDEAHCVSVWGHEFRADYRNLGQLKQNFPNIPIALFSATATKIVQDDILKSLNLTDVNIFRAKTKRDNLHVSILKRHSKEQIISILNNHKNQSGIIYTFTRAEAEKLAIFLQNKNYKALAYHAKMSPTTKDEVFHKFIYDEINIVVATIAFGMGIDKSNIRFVIHTSLPKTLENYYQEIGRAGRDGEASFTYLLYSKSDEIKRLEQIKEAEDKNYQQISKQKLQKMYQFCTSSKCRHQLIAKYFDDEIEKCENFCDNCTKGEIVLKDISVEAQKVLSAIYKTSQMFGMSYIIDILRGLKGAKILQNEHEKLSVYGIGKDLNKAQWINIIDTLIDEEALHVNEFKSLKLSAKGIDILKGNLKININEELLHVDKNEKNEQVLSVDDENFTKFKNLRAKLAKEQNVPAYIVFDDKTLKQICQKLPLSEDEFLSINGVGEVKLKRYFEAFKPLINEIKQDPNTPKTKLTNTHLQTLNLIKQNLNLNEIANLRDMQISTILLHVKALNEQNQITNEQKERIFSQANIPEIIKKWINEGRKLDSIQNLKAYLSVFEILQNE